MADTWHVIQVESDTLADLCEQAQTALNSTWVPVANYDPSITVYRGASKHYSMFILFFGDAAP